MVEGTEAASAEPIRGLGDSVAAGTRVRRGGALEDAFADPDGEVLREKVNESILALRW